MQPGFGGVIDTYFLTFNLNTNSVEFATYVGGSGQEVLSRPMTTSDGGVLLFGGTSSPGFKTTSGVIGETYSGGQSDGAIVKFAGPSPVQRNVNRQLKFLKDFRESLEILNDTLP